jgi:hypothetical protein
MARQKNDQAILIDRAAAAELPSEEVIREWARDKRGFVSSVMAEFEAERQAAVEALREVGLRPVIFEEFGGRDADPEQAYLSEVEASDIYIGILGKRYGKQLKSGFSATHAEYIHAKQHGLRIAIWAMAAPDREGHQRSFLDDARVFHVVPEVQSVDILKRQIAERLKHIAAEELAPWCKLGNLIFRSYEVEADGKTIKVLAQVRDDAVVRALEEARGDKWSRGQQMQFTWSGRSSYVKVSGVNVTTTTDKSKRVRLELEVEGHQRETVFEVSVGNKTPDDLTEIGLRSVLFGERDSVSDWNSGFGFLAEMDDPLQPLRDNPVSEEIIRPLAELMLTELLVGSGRAESIREFRLGVSASGQRSVSLTWETPKRYSNKPSEVRSIQGNVRI